MECDMTPEREFEVRFTTETDIERMRVLAALSALATSDVSVRSEGDKVLRAFLPDDILLDAAKRILNRAKTVDDWVKTETPTIHSSYL